MTAIATPGSLIGAIERYVRSHWAELPVRAPMPHAIEYVAEASGVSKLVLFLFVNAAPRPALVAKVARRRSQDERFLAESRAIGALRARLPEQLAATLPGPLYTANVDGRPVTFEPYLSGRAMDALIAPGKPLTPATAAAALQPALHWLIDVQRVACRGTPPPDQPCRQAVLLAPIERARHVSDFTTAESAYLARLEHETAPLVHDLPLYIYHGDFRPGNVLVDDRGQLRVLDWEFTRPLGPPLIDWFSFAFRLYSWSLALADIDGQLALYRRAFSDVFQGGNWFADVVSTYTREYCRALSIPQDLIPLMLGLFVVDSINKFAEFLRERVEADHLYMMKGAPVDPTFRRQLRRQAYVWLLGDLAARAGFS